MKTVYRSNAPFRLLWIEICVNSCYTFIRPAEDKCPFCLELRYKISEKDDGKIIPRKIHQKLTIAPQLVSIFTNSSLIDAISISHPPNDSSCIKNIFNRSLFKDIKDHKLIGSQHDLFLALYIDGYQTHNRGVTKLNIIMLHILNLPESKS